MSNRFREECTLCILDMMRSIRNVYGDERNPAIRFCTYVSYIMLHLEYVSDIFIGQSPYAEHNCHKLSGSALAYSTQSGMPTASVRTIKSQLESGTYDSLIDKMYDRGELCNRVVVELSRQLTMILRESHIMVHCGVVMLNACYMRDHTALDASRQTHIVQRFVRSLIMHSNCNTGRTVHIHTLGENARVCANPVVSQLSQCASVSIKLTASANPASRNEAPLSSHSMGALLSTLRFFENRLYSWLLPRMVQAKEPTATRDMDARAYVQQESLKTAALQTQVTLLCKAFDSLVMKLEEANPAVDLSEAKRICREARDNLGLLAKSLGPSRPPLSTDSGGMNTLSWTPPRPAAPASTSVQTPQTSAAGGSPAPSTGGGMKGPRRRNPKTPGSQPQPPSATTTPSKPPVSSPAVSSAAVTPSIAQSPAVASVPASPPVLQQPVQIAPSVTQSAPSAGVNTGPLASLPEKKPAARGQKWSA